METINWDTINYDFLQEICNIYNNINNIEDEQDKIKELFILLFNTTTNNIEYIKEHIKVFYFLEHNDNINIVEEVLRNIRILRINYIELFNNNNNNMINLINNIINDNISIDTSNNALNEDELNKIPSLKYSEISNECIECPICLDTIEQEHIVRNLKCKHIYHIKCIDEYLLNYNYKCPTCRTECDKN